MIARVSAVPIVLFCVSFLHAQENADPKIVHGRIVVDKTPFEGEMDLGDVAPGSSVIVGLDLVNALSTTLALAGVESSCGCLAERRSASPIPMRQSGRMELLLKAPSSSGLFRRTLLVRTASPSGGEIHLNLHGNVRAPFSLVGDRVIKSPENGGHVFIEVKNEYEGDYSVSSAGFRRGMARLVALRTLDSGSQELEIALQANGSRAGTLEDVLYLESSSMQHSKTTIPLVLDFGQRISVAPNPCFLRVSEDGDTMHGRVFVILPSGDQVPCEQNNVRVYVTDEKDATSDLELTMLESRIQWKTPRLGEVVFSLPIEECRRASSPLRLRLTLFGEIRETIVCVF